MSKIEKLRYWVEDFTYDEFKDFIDEGQMIFFRYKNNDYMLELFDNGYLIADPIPYDDNGGMPDEQVGQYPESFQAKNSEELLKLPFLDGKTVEEVWNDIRFWNY